MSPRAANVNADESVQSGLICASALTVNMSPERPSSMEEMGGYPMLTHRSIPGVSEAAAPSVSELVRTDVAMVCHSASMAVRTCGQGARRSRWTHRPRWIRCTISLPPRCSAVSTAPSTGRCRTAGWSKTTWREVRRHRGRLEDSSRPRYLAASSGSLPPGGSHGPVRDPSAAQQDHLIGNAHRAWSSSPSRGSSGCPRGHRRREGLPRRDVLWCGPSCRSAAGQESAPGPGRN